ncbi:MAG: 2-polyprenyl-3-methyl-5-hydroxy-6-metoxy-1,4-benzoquinol methylase [Planctomycetota bacterium]|jgi:2-polyprenyl-3-methyl-5-hydroxy-6-metoxy-1,4-benzoquinol methylase
MSLNNQMLLATKSGEVELRRADGRGYLHVWPRIEADEHTKFYREDFYGPEHFAKAELEIDYWREFWNLRRERIEEALGTPPANRPLRILDVGCAGGFFLESFRSKGWHVEGVEPSITAVEYARSRFGLDVTLGTLEELELGESFDAVHCSLVLEHLSDPDFAVERMRDFLRPGGVLFVECPNEFNALQLAVRDQLHKESWWINPAHHLNYFDYDSLSKLLADHGLDEVERLATFPMEMFALMGSDYIGNNEVGLACHKQRMQFERNLIAAGGGETLVDMYRALADTGLGRTCSVLARRTER